MPARSYDRESEVQLSLGSPNPYLAQDLIREIQPTLTSESYQTPTQCTYLIRWVN